MINQTHVVSSRKVDQTIEGLESRVYVTFFIPVVISYFLIVGHKTLTSHFKLDILRTFYLMENLVSDRQVNQIVIVSNWRHPALSEAINPGGEEVGRDVYPLRLHLSDQTTHRRGKTSINFVYNVENCVYSLFYFVEGFFI